MKIIIIGAGPGGYESAIWAARHGADVTLIEKKNLGGTCMNVGCIPTKAVLAASEIFDAIKLAGKNGLNIKAKDATLDPAKTVGRKDKVVASLTGGIEHLLSDSGVTLVQGEGRLVDAHTVCVVNAEGEQTLTADKVLLAMGSVPVMPAMFGYDGKQIISSDEALALTEIPATLAIVGGGVIGCELGQYFARMGCKVTIVEMAPTILPGEDAEVSEELARHLKRSKIKMITGVGVESVETELGGVTLTLADGKTVVAEKVLVAIGRRANTEGLNADSLGLNMDDRGRIVVDNRMRTSLSDVYAIGDLVPTPFLAHVASREGIVAVADMLGLSEDICYNAVPRCVYTEPQVAAVGMTEAQAEAAGITTQVGRFDVRALGKAQATGLIAGFAKVIVDAEDKIIGGVVVGANATEMIGELTMAVQFGLTATQLGAVIHPHPSMNEAILEAAHDVHGQSVNKLRKD